MKWQNKLTKSEIKHLSDSGITTLRGARVNAKHQAVIRARNKEENLPIGIGEPCFKCKHINVTLGLPI